MDFFVPEPIAPDVPAEEPTTWVHRCMIVTAAHAPLAQLLCGLLAGPAGHGMFTAGLSPDGGPPVSMFVSTGLIDAKFAALMADPVLLAATCAGAGIPVTDAQCHSLLADADISTDQPHAVFARRGLRLVAA